MRRNHQLLVIGTSAGGFSALAYLIPKFPKNFYPVAVVIHLKDQSDSLLASLLDSKSQIHVREAEPHIKFTPGNVYIAPPGYHLLIESDHTFSLSVEEPVRFSRPSIDVLFESAAIACHGSVTGVLLTGANSDGARGLLEIKNHGGLTIVQDPATAESPTMPQSAIDLFQVDKILSLENISKLLLSMV